MLGTYLKESAAISDTVAFAASYTQVLTRFIVRYYTDRLLKFYT